MIKNDNRFFINPRLESIIKMLGFKAVWRGIPNNDNEMRYYFALDQNDMVVFIGDEPIYMTDENYGKGLRIDLNFDSWEPICKKDDLVLHFHEYYSDIENLVPHFLFNHVIN